MAFFFSITYTLLGTVFGIVGAALLDSEQATPAAGWAFVGLGALFIVLGAVAFGVLPP